MNSLKKQGHLPTLDHQASLHLGVSFYQRLSSILPNMETKLRQLHLAWRREE